MRSLKAILSHLDKLILLGAGHFGPRPCGLWPSAIDPRTGGYPQDDRRDPAWPKRVYRNIDAPRGSSVYWDLPSLVAAHQLSAHVGSPRWALAADACLRAFYDRCVSRTGLLLWGNHYYFNAFRGQVMKFHGQEDPHAINPAEDDGELHELRPIRPPWQLLWRISPEITERHIRQMGERHVCDPDTGAFNRHADGRVDHAFVESGGILVESLAWLSAKVEDPSLADHAVRIARYSYEHRNRDTGLVPNNPTGGRWDADVCTTEIGLWARCLLRAADLTDKDELAGMARDAVEAYLRYGFDEQAQRYYGKVRLADGQADFHADTVYQPGGHSDVWNADFPTHDYPLILAEACLDLYERTDKPVFGLAAQRWMRILRACPPQAAPRGAYAEPLGRAISLLHRAANVLDDPSLLELARDYAAHATTALVTEGMFTGHPDKPRYEAVDGVGLLLLALLELQAGRVGNIMQADP